MTVFLDHEGRRFAVQPYGDASDHDGPAIELAEVVAGELEYPLLVALLPPAGETGSVTLRLTEGTVPLPVLQAFLAEIPPRSG